jgi:quinol monooxygenase YgiN
MAIYLTARFHVRPQAIDVCKQAIKELVEYTEKHEPGTLLYLAQQEILNPRIFHNTIIFESDAAMLLHQNSNAADRFVSTVYPQTIEPVEFMEHNLVALKK